MATGQVKWFSETKGYGFIIPGDGSKDVFFHHSNVQDTSFQRKFGADQKVEYELAQGQKGPQAQNVRAPGTPIDATKSSQPVATKGGARDSRGGKPKQGQSARR